MEMNNPSPQFSDNIVLTYDELATRLNIPKRSLERLVSKGKIPHRRVGRFVRFYWPHIVDWLANTKGAKRR